VCLCFLVGFCSVQETARKRRQQHENDMFGKLAHSFNLFISKAKYFCVRL